jgi:hypothetical protein
LPEDKLHKNSPPKSNMEDKIIIAREKLEITFPLKEKQMETLQHVYEGKDCISVLPTGYEKSIIYQMMPWFLQKDLDRPGMSAIRNYAGSGVVSFKERNREQHF